MTIGRTIAVAAVLIAGVAPLSAQETADLPGARLIYADDITAVEILDFTGTPVEPVTFGSRILIGFAIRTGATTVELRLEPNGSIMRLDEQTFLKFEEMQGLENTEVNSAALIDGAARVVAARGRGRNYRFTTGAVALGVRGTDFTLRADADRTTRVTVTEGEVELFEPETRRRARVASGEAAVADLAELAIDVLSTQEAPTPDAGLTRFEQLDPAAVPREVEAGFRNEFDYFSEIEAQAYREFFGGEDFFADFAEYLARFRDYYESEMADFEALLEREAAELERRNREADAAIERDERAFREWLEENS